MGRGKPDRAFPPPAQAGQYRIPQNVTQHTNYPGASTQHYSMDHATQNQQVDSWRSYRNDTITLQTSTDPQRYQTTHDPIMHDSQPPHLYQGHLREINPDPSSYRRSQPQGSQYAPYQALRTPNGSHERQVVPQAQRASDRVAPQNTSRYPFRHRRVDQIAPYSTRAADDIPVPSIEDHNVSADSSAPPNLPTRKIVGRRSRTRTATPEFVESPPPPTASAEYKKKAAFPPARRETPQKLLIVLDLNGTLLVRPNRRKDPTKFKIRPGVTQLLNYLFEHHIVMVYSSARPENAMPMVTNLIHPKQRQLMAGVWARDKLDLTKAQYNSKVQVYKKLHKIWDDRTIQAKAEPGRKWDQSNTILVDDSQLKALAQPHNLLQVPEFEDNAPREGGKALRDWQLNEQANLVSLEQKLEELKWQVDVSRLIREWQTGKRHAPGVVDEAVDQKTHRSFLQQHPPTPTPSVGQPDTPENSRQSPAQSSGRTTTSTEDETDAGGGVDISGISILDTLEEEIDRALHPETAVTNDGRRSESPIDENVWKEILSGSKKGDKQTEKRSSSAVPPTPESMST
ncbi:hypothetical protein A1O3_08003 [Capronia epimyces CBS 606.96]|uniref:Mitochondrial import inner membrane translocase subunit TIM50 n=1 Tax=Capronia epimyces CBS 606.96 TaxID=1182542 RepID=W9XQV5_9EURO|nr:uncharacterized protein A1O3_08003 [Capronia epimyces CBS 606.96]EXJ79720.1 hypothetical protein A1O3_08003 [Capronia epimyces CBS 606.96]